MSCTLTVDIFVSVDGWAGSDSLPGYFGYFGPELDEWITTELAAPQVVVMGRKTYEALAGLPDEARDESTDRMSQLDKIVFSRTLQRADWPNTQICGDDVVDEIRRLKADGGVRLRTMGSLSLARQLTDAGLVDRLRLMTFPLIAGDAGRETVLRRPGVRRSRAGRPPRTRRPHPPRGVSADRQGHPASLSVRA